MCSKKVPVRRWIPAGGSCNWDIWVLCRPYNGRQTISMPAPNTKWSAIKITSNTSSRPFCNFKFIRNFVSPSITWVHCTHAIYTDLVKLVVSSGEPMPARLPVVWNVNLISFYFRQWNYAARCLVVGIPTAENHDQRQHCPPIGRRIVEFLSTAESLAGATEPRRSDRMEFEHRRHQSIQTVDEWCIQPNQSRIHDHFFIISILFVYCFRFSKIKCLIWTLHDFDFILRRKEER